MKLTRVVVFYITPPNVENEDPSQNHFGNGSELLITTSGH